MLGLVSLGPVILMGFLGTLLGWLGLGDVRASDGAKKGRGLGMFAALAWPLLVAGAIEALVIGRMTLVLFPRYRPGAPAGGGGMACCLRRHLFRRHPPDLALAPRTSGNRSRHTAGARIECRLPGGRHRGGGHPSGGRIVRVLRAFIPLHARLSEAGSGDGEFSRGRSPPSPGAAGSGGASPAALTCFACPRPIEPLLRRRDGRWLRGRAAIRSRRERRCVSCALGTTRRCWCSSNGRGLGATRRATWRIRFSRRFCPLAASIRLIKRKAGFAITCWARSSTLSPTSATMRAARSGAGVFRTNRSMGQRKRPLRGCASRMQRPCRPTLPSTVNGR